MEVSAKIHGIFLKYFSAEDIHVYSIDEVFVDLTAYLPFYRLSAHALAERVVNAVFQTTGITATVGIGTNLYLAKIAMDILAKKMPADEKGMRIAELDEMSYRYEMWAHKPIQDFWRVGRGYTKKLHAAGLYTMGDIARYSLGKRGEDKLYQLFGINAELLIDHAWGWEPCAIADVKSYQPRSNSISSGQVLQSPYTAEKAKIIVREMVDRLVLDLVNKGVVTNQFVLTIGYDKESLTNPEVRYTGEVVRDAYGREIPKHAHGTANLEGYSSSSKEIVEAVLQLYDRIVNQELLVRRVTIAACSCDCSGCSEEGAEAAGFIYGCRRIGKTEEKGGGTPKRKAAAKSHFADSKEIRKKRSIKRNKSLGRCNHEGTEQPSGRPSSIMGGEKQ